jgi:hypothetical protein
LDTIFEQILGYPHDQWKKGSAVDTSWSRTSITGDIIKPQRIWEGEHEAFLPVFVPDTTARRHIARLGIGNGRRAVARVIEWLRLSSQKIAVLTNGRQFRLIHAGSDYEAWCEWDIELWFQEGTPGPQIDALRFLLDHACLQKPEPQQSCMLISVIEESRKGQAELSSALGENVRLAVEKLIDASASALNELDSVPDKDDLRRAIYIAATRIIMRMVVILFAEARELLPRYNPIYNDSYSLQSLLEQLERMSSGGKTSRLASGHSAWPRIRSLFSLIYHGSSHPAMVIQKYGGGLFQHGDANHTSIILT